jgi:hypothetical protein
MAKTTAPLLSFGGSGQIAKTQVYSSWKGIQYARRYVIPANPNTANQQITRNVFKFTSALIKLATPGLSEVWTAFAKGKPLTSRNAFMSANIKALRGQSESTDMVFSNGANGGLVAAGLACAVSGKVITATITAPTLPDGWTIVSAVAVANLQQNPEAYTDPNTYEGDDTSTPYAPTITVVNSGTYVVGAWFKFNAGTVDAPIYKYGASISTTAVVA